MLSLLLLLLLLVLRLLCLLCLKGRLHDQWRAWPRHCGQSRITHVEGHALTTAVPECLDLMFWECRRLCILVAWCWRRQRWLHQTCGLHGTSAAEIDIRDLGTALSQCCGCRIVRQMGPGVRFVARLSRRLRACRIRIHVPYSSFLFSVYPASRHRASRLLYPSRMFAGGCSIQAAVCTLDITGDVDSSVPCHVFHLQVPDLFGLYPPKSCVLAIASLVVCTAAALLHSPLLRWRLVRYDHQPVIYAGMRPQRLRRGDSAHERFSGDFSLARSSGCCRCTTVVAANTI